MRRLLIGFLSAMMSLCLFSTSLTIYLEDSTSPCEVFVNEKSVGTVKDSLVMSDIEEGAYKVSLFSPAVSNMSIPESSLNEMEQKARKLDSDKMNIAVKLGTETVYVSKLSSSKVTIKNKQAINALVIEKKSSSCCCLGGAAGGCLLIGGSVTLLGLLGWGIYMLITEGLPDIF